MEDVICYCAICQGQVPFEDVKTLNAACSPQPLTTDKVYCPHCEMLVEPVTANVTALGNVDPAFRGDVPGDRGRSRSGGTNAGGSQRGDVSDEGATQWRSDPEEAERNTWRPKH